MIRLYIMLIIYRELVNFTQTLLDWRKGHLLLMWRLHLLESMYALDAALKAANVHVAEFWGPPTVTNCGGALLTGTQSACKAAVDAFANAVAFAVDRPLEI